MSFLSKDPEAAVRSFVQLERERIRREDAKPETLRRFYADPLAFVMWAWRWGMPGPLERFKGPDIWQKEFLLDLGEQIKSRGFDGRNPVKPIKMAVSAGHGVGKGALAAWLTCFIMSTRPYAHGTVTANTFSQLETKTWAQIEHWFKTSRTAKDFLIGASGVKHRTYGRSWLVTPQTCREENSEAFAGQHAATSTSFYIFDESSSIPEKIFEVAEEGGMTDGEPHFYVFGNPTRPTGRFHRICFGDERSRWNSRVIDSRDAMMPNKEVIAEQIEHYGEDSDVVRVRVKGLPPKSSDLQFIDAETIYLAQKRTFETLQDEPLIAGIDCARGGMDKFVIRFRRGDDARSIPPIKIPGEELRDSMKMVSKLADLSTRKFNGLTVAMWFVDGGSMGGPCIDRLHQLGHKNFVEITFGAGCPDPRHYGNMRAYMWFKMREALRGRLAIDKDRDLETDLTGPGVHQGKEGGKTDEWYIESKDKMKARGLDSPNDADALCLTWAQPVRPPAIQKPRDPTAWQNNSHPLGWMA